MESVSLDWILDQKKELIFFFFNTVRDMIGTTAKNVIRSAE